MKKLNNLKPKKQMENLAKAVIAVMKEVKGMEKNSRVGRGNAAYNGTKDQDVKEVFNEALSNNGLCVLPIDIEENTDISRWEEEQVYQGVSQGIKQKQSVFTKVNTKYLLLHESGESQVIAGYGHGVDPQDKGAGKATTYALKNALLYTFLTPVGKIDDTDTTHSNDIQTKVVKKPLTDTQYNAVIESKNIDHINYFLSNSTMTNDQRNELQKILKTK